MSVDVHNKTKSIFSPNMGMPWKIDIDKKSVHTKIGAIEYLLPIKLAAKLIQA